MLNARSLTLKDLIAAEHELGNGENGILRLVSENGWTMEPAIHDMLIEARTLLRRLQKSGGLYGEGKGSGGMAPPSLRSCTYPSKCKVQTRQRQ